ncbi:MAG: HlyD family secretion protein, partial [Rhodospirillales bacterium]
PDPAVSPARRAARNPFAFPLFDPQRVLRVVAWLCRPLRFVVWTLIPGVLLACLVLFHNPGPFAHDLVDAVHDIRTVPMFFLGLVIVNLFSQIVQGAVATGFGARVDVFGVRLLFGFFPRFYVDREPVRTLSRRGRLWCYAAPLLARLSLFAGGTFVWISYRGTGTWWPDLALISSQLGLFVFLVTAMPLAPNDGYRWLSEYLGRPAFMNNAWTALVRTLSGRPLPEALSGIEKWALFLFASGTLIFAGLLVVPVVFYASTFLERRFSGTGVVIFLCLFGLFILWLLVGWRSLRRFRTRGGGAAAEGRGALVPVEAERGRVLPFEAQPPARWRTTAVGAPSGFPTIEAGRSRTRVFPRLFWLVVLAGLAVAAFLPYRYETGGSFTILPTSRVEVHSRIDGEVLEIFVREGDWVEEGQVLAALSTWKEERDLAVTEAKLDEARARLRRLEEGSKPEEIELAEKQVASARTKVAFSKLSAERAAILVEKGHISRQSAEDAVSEYELNKANLSVAEANLRLVRSAATESEVEALRAEVRALERETEFRRAEIERARILAPVAGRVVTKNLHFNLGKHLPLGTLFAEIEDLRLAQVEVEVPESDIAEVRIGSKVRLKAWGASETERVGTVVGIAPVTEPREYGEIVRVTTEVANDDGFLKTGMSGYGKIEGSEMPAWQAFTRLFVRFFRIEFWSWIP